MQAEWEKDPDFIYLGGDKKVLQQERTAPHDGKKATWVPDPAASFLLGEIQSTTGDKVKVKIQGGSEKEFKKEQLQQVNPPKFYKCDDMANMTYLNEASVLFNLKVRYEAMMIYTYSGLFCVAVNPYKRLPIYGSNIVNQYRGKRRAEMPPHLFSIADTSYQNMVRDRENQSMLITGESGAGKTENTKKVIAYFASVAKAGIPGADDDPTKKKIGLEDQIVQTNPVLEAYGNAKTVRNNNSSRFGKFIRIHFGASGKIAGADIETYLLEKSRVTYQQPGIERNYHVFYFLTSKWAQDKKYCDMVCVKPEPANYFYINQGCLTVDNWDDCEEGHLMDVAFVDLGFSEADYHSFYRSTGSILHFGDMKFKQRPREEQAEADGTAEAEKVAHLLGVNCVDMLKCLLTPKVKVGNDMVTKNQTMKQVQYAVAALAKCLYDRMFKWLVMRVNKTLDTKNKRQYFIGVLDIAGFEIFDYNTFEQLCINYTNERLQQFFNHHMFVLEQEEYKKEGIVWEFINFGMDLQACIDLIEKPLGILSILEEECMFPKASDDTFREKLFDNHGKNPNFSKPRPSKKKLIFEPHFELSHYAGVVGYNITGWLDKNKDPINQTVIDLLAASSEPLVAYYFQPPPEEGGGKKKKKGGSSQTLSAVHKEQLTKLMATLYSTHPSFVRCLIPNEQKKSGLIESKLVLHQLQCNGVLEGIRICRKGFPNRMLYPEFKQRYSILAPNAIPSTGFVDAKEATGKVLAAQTFEQQDVYRIGNTKVFFKAGILGTLEDMRDDRLGWTISNFQAHIYGYLIRRNYKKLQDQRTALSVIQRNIRQWFGLKGWMWYDIYCRIKPMLKSSIAADEMKQKEKQYEKDKDILGKLEGTKKDLEGKNVMLQREIEELVIELKAANDGASDIEERIGMLTKETNSMAATMKKLEEKLKEEEGTGGELEEIKRKLDEKTDGLKKDMAEVELNLQKVEDDKKSKDAQIETLSEEMARQEESIAKLSKEKKQSEDAIKKMQEDLANEESKANGLNKLKQKLEGQVDELEENLEREKKGRSDVDKVVKKIEGDLRAAQETVEELERVKSGLEDNLRKKEAEIKETSERNEETSNLIAQLQKKIKELQARIEELETELELERNARSKVEKQRNDLNRELSDLGERVEEAGGATMAQADLTKKREQDLQKVKRDLEEAITTSEVTMTNLRKKHQDTVEELSDQVDQLNKSKNKAEKERSALKSELAESQQQADNMAKNKAASEKLCKKLEAQLNETIAKHEDLSRNINDMDSTKSKLGSETSEYTRLLEDAESSVASLTRAKQDLSKQLEEVKSSLEEESRIRAKLQGESRNAQCELESVREQLEEEQELKSDLQRLLQKANNEAAMWRHKIESGEGGVSQDNVDAMKKKLGDRLAEAESNLEAAQSKIASLEKIRNRLSGELEDVTVEVERATSLAANADKKQRQFDKVIQEWQRKCDDLSNEVDAAQKEAQSNAAESYRLKAQLDEGQDNIVSLRRENKSLSDEIHDITSQLSDGGRGIHEQEKTRRRLEQEKTELQNALEEAESALETEEVKGQRAQLEMASVKSDVDRRLAEKDEEFESTRKNHQRSLDSMNVSLEAESRGKNDALRMKKKLEADINELELALDTGNRGRAEAEKNIKRYQNQAREIQQTIEEEQRARDEAREQYNNSERRANMMAGEIEELRAQLEVAERGRKSAEGELSEAADRVSELSTVNSSLTANKRKLDSNIQAMQADLDEQSGELRSVEESAKKALADAARVAEELRQEQEHGAHIEKMRRTLDAQVKELQARLDEAEAAAMKGGKRMIQKLEQRVRELEVELDNEQRRHGETGKQMRKQDKNLKDLAYQGEEDRKNGERMQDMINKLQDKIKTYKRQVEEAEEIAAVNLAKYRKVQHELEDAEERADMAENTLAKLRAKGRTSMSAGRQMTAPQ